MKLILGLEALDLKVFRFFNSFAGKSCALDVVLVFFAEYLQYLIGIAFVLLLFFWWRGKGKRLRVFLVTVSSALIARLGVVELVRFFYHRPRPFLSHQVHQLLTNGEWSFPSGHSAFFFAVATAVYLYDKKWGVVFFIAGILMNVSRIAGGIHYPSDILGGLAIGMAVAWIVYYLAEVKNANRKQQ